VQECAGEVWLLICMCTNTSTVMAGGAASRCGVVRCGDDEG
jgi:hypothetical protein